MCCGSDNSTSTITTDVPDYIESFARGTLNQADQVSQQAYQPYGGPRVAGFTGDQTAAFDMARDSAGNWVPAWQLASDTAGNLANQSFANVDMNAYMNPYMQGVIDPIRQQGAAQRAQLEREAVASGAWGGGRHGVVEAQQRRNEDQIVAQALASGFESSANRYYQDQAGRAQGAQLSGQLAGVGSELAGIDINRLLGIGGQQQMLGQANLDTAYGDFAEQRDWPMRGLNVRSGAITGTPYETSQTQTGPAANNTAQTIGALGAFAGGIGTLEPWIWFGGGK